VANELGAPRARQALAAGDPELRLREVDSGQELRHRMLDLEASVHLDEVEAVVRREKELDRPRTSVPQLVAGAPRRLLHLSSQIRVDGR
jgi:hypothetical protein